MLLERKIGWISKGMAKADGLSMSPSEKCLRDLSRACHEHGLVSQEVTWQPWFAGEQAGLQGELAASVLLARRDESEVRPGQENSRALTAGRSLNQ